MFYIGQLVDTGCREEYASVFRALVFEWWTALLSVGGLGDEAANGAGVAAALR